MSAPDLAGPASWDDPAILRARQAAQDAAKRVATRAETLRAQAVQQWAEAQFAAAQADADTGSRAFEHRDFTTALTAYRKALEGLDALATQAKRELAKALATGTAALARGDGPAAGISFDLALAIAPENAAARRGRARVQTLDTVMSRIESARALERAGDLEAAAAGYRAALKLDREMAPAREALTRVEAILSERRFRRAVAEGLSALEHNDFDTAGQAYARARAIRPDAPAVADGLARIQNGQRSRNITTLREQAQAAERNEDWHTALARHQAALALDQTLSFAREGLARSQIRAKLADRLQFFVDHPRRLYTQAVYTEAETLLRDARAAAAGPLLTRQIEALTQALRIAATPVPVRLQSDNATEVTVFKVGTLGRFESKDLRLKPGRYVAIGACPGYRDVRREFDVGSGTPAAPIIVRCEERL